jgi:hypothetical protein
MDDQREDELLAELLSPLDRVLPATRRRQRRLAGVSLATAAATALAVTGIAVAAATGSWGPLAGIGAADRPPEPSDTLSADVSAQLQADTPPLANSVDQIGERLADQARRIGQLPDGRSVYAIPSSKGKLCIEIAHGGGVCADPLTANEPITLTTSEEGPGSPPIVWGVALDQVTAVSFDAGSFPVHVPVSNNFFAWQGQPFQFGAGISNVTVMLRDGSTVALG